MTEKSKKHYQQFAFPVGDSKMAENLITLGISPFGMSKRYLTACMAMNGLTSSATIRDVNEEKISRMAYKIADEMLKQENQ
jgi:hypothetical protein